ncbi:MULTISPECIES: GtrA family protein [Pseudomonas]|uniref:GtrA family protein n=1 Tax=Pseudomonas TaxID=286 RepID=UPI000D33EDD8|nr:GtrA family protein [Pseudomonas putida]PTV64945.1 GtrA family protein [Pseudomonas putida]
MSTHYNRSGESRSPTGAQGANGEGGLLKAGGTKTLLVRFLFAGGMATLLQYLTLWVCVHAFQTSAALGSGLGYFLGSVLNYLINYFFTFGVSEKHTRVAWRFYVMVFIGWSINTACMGLLADTLQWNKWVAQILATALSMASNFSLSKSWVFKKNK